MPFYFSHVCDLLQQVADLPPARRSQPKIANETVYAWFRTHRQAIDGLVNGADSSSATVLLSTLLPDRRPDRVYALQARSLQRIIIRALGLGRSRVPELARWMRPTENGDAVDLADCVEGILKRTPNPIVGKPVTVEEIDAVLHAVAARCRFSGPAVRGAAAASLASTNAALGRLYQRLDPCGAKWLTRLILKDFRPAVLDGTAVARAFHPSLPLALQVHSDLAAAVSSLHPLGKTDGSGRDDMARALVPRLGVKVGRQLWTKGRSIQHCIAMGGPQPMSCERKMDGEYVQVHVDLSRGADECLQLFSKSGKDSTWDRVNLHSAILESLRIGQPDCKITSGCILEGEMVAYHEKERRILDFDSIRKHVNRSGSRLYSNPKVDTLHNEHLMIVYFDVLLVDGESLLATRHADRFRRLEQLVSCRQGYAELVQREVIDFGSHTAAAQLRHAFARCITACLEGLVIKADNDPYFDFCRAAPRPADWSYLRSCAIKLKKGYINGFGDVGDFAVVGGRYDAAKAREYPADLPRLRWTHFYLGCLDTEASTPTRPRFVVTNVVTLAPAQMATFLTHCRPRVVPAPKVDRRRRDVDDDVDANADVHVDDVPFDLARLDPGIDHNQGGPTELFAEPPVVDIRCFAFHRQGYGDFWSPRFPVVVKFHFDRTYADALTFASLQAMAEAEAARREEEGGGDGEGDGEGQAEDGDDEWRHWIARLERADPRGIPVDAETSQSSAAATTTTARSQPSDTGTSQLSSRSAGAPLVESAEATEANGYESHESELERESESGSESDAESELSIATVKSPVTKVQPVVTVIDLTGEDDEGQADSQESVILVGYNGDEDRGPIECAELPSSPLLLQKSPATPTMSRTTPPPSSPQSPYSQFESPIVLQNPFSSSPVQPMASLDTLLSSPGCSQSSVQEKESQDSARAGGQRSTQSSPGTSPSRKRLRAWDIASMFPAVSPPQLKRARSDGQ